MKLSTRYQTKGLLRIVRGTAKEFAGRITSNKMMGVKGKFERLTGTVQRKIGKAQGLCGF